MVETADGKLFSLGTLIALKENKNCIDNIKNVEIVFMIFGFNGIIGFS